MKRIALVVLVLAAAWAAPDHLPKAAEACSATKCVAPDCRCASTAIPGDLEASQVPQFVMFTFDDAIQETNYNIYTELFYNKTNADGCPVGATFYTSHEYTDYSKAHDLYVHGHEIALHSISHSPNTEYWKGISIDDLTREFGGEKQLVAHFANIPDEAIKGMRVPFLQLSGDNSFQVASDIGLLYDCSWPTQTYRKPGLWPYTLDYLSSQDCLIGPCPTDAIPGLWVVPMIDWTDQQNQVCSMVDACVNIPDDDAEALTQWFIDNFNVQYNGNRAPFGFYVHAAYFAVNEIRLEAYKKFVDYLVGLDDVYLVPTHKVIDWVKRPVALGSASWPACEEVEDLGCTPLACHLQKVDDANPDRYMTQCGDCPSVYPWLDNPLGD